MSATPGGFDFEQLRKMLEQMGIDPAAMGMDLEQLMEQVQQMQKQGGLVFGMTPADQDPDAAWRTTITAAVHLVQQQGPDTALHASERAAVVDAERLVQSWLTDHTVFPGSSLPAHTMVRDEWLELTANGWRGIVEPIIEGLADALERGADMGGPEELADFTSMLAPMMRTSASMLYRDRLKRVLADVASDTLTGTEVGIGVLPRHQVAILTSNVAQFTEDLGLPETDVLLYLLLREAARQRLFANVGWLTPQVNALLAHFAREIRIDLESIAGELDPSTMQDHSLEAMMAVGERLRGSFFKPASTETQLEILGRLQTMLALVEGWVDHVTSRVTSQWMPNGSQLVEVIRRRRATGGPTQRVLTDLIGLELSPRLVRDAENLWAAVDHERGLDGRDAVWRHPDLMPTRNDLQDPLAFTQADQQEEQPEEDEMDRELRKLLESEGRD